MSKIESTRKAGRRKVIRHSVETRKKALEIFQNGGGYKLCARALDIPVYTARDWHRSYQLGTFRTDRKVKQQIYTSEQKATVLKLRNKSNLSYNKISQLTKVNRATVLMWIKSEQK